MDPPGYSTQRKEAEGDTLVIALDFGTTFSGYVSLHPAALSVPILCHFSLFCWLFCI